MKHRSAKLDRQDQYHHSDETKAHSGMEKFFVKIFPKNRLPATFHVKQNHRFTLRRNLPEHSNIDASIFALTSGSVERGTDCSSPTRRGNIEEFSYQGSEVPRSWPAFRRMQLIVSRETHHTTKRQECGPRKSEARILYCCTSLRWRVSVLQDNHST